MELDPKCEHDWFMEFDSSQAKNDQDFENMGYRQCCIKCGGHVGERMDIEATINREKVLGR